MLGDRDGPGPAFALFADFQVFGPDAEGSDAGVAGRLSGHEVHLGGADEASDEQVCGPLVQFERRAVLFDASRVEHNDLVGHGHGLDLIVGDVDGGGPELLLQLGDFQAHLDAERGVEVRQGLVEQKCLRLAHKGAVLDFQVGILDDVDRPERLADSLERYLAHGLSPFVVYLTAPKVSPWTSCRWVNHPSMMIGAMASVEAADSFAQNRPSGLE